MFLIVGSVADIETPISSNVQDTFVPPFTDLPVPPIVNVLVAPQVVVVISPVPLKSVPLIFLVVVNLVAVFAFPLIEMPQVPDAPTPVFVGTYEL